MTTNFDKLERILEAIAGDIFNDVEYAKAIINEAGFDSTITSTEGEKRLKQIQDEAFIRAKQPIKCIVRNFNAMSLDIPLIGGTLYRIDEGDVESNYKLSDSELSFRIITFRPNYNGENISSSKHLDEERFQFN